MSIEQTKEIIDKQCICGHLKKQDHKEVNDYFGHDYKEKCKVSNCLCTKFIGNGWVVIEDNIYNNETGRFNDTAITYIEKYRGSWIHS